MGHYDCKGCDASPGDDHADDCPRVVSKGNPMTDIPQWAAQNTKLIERLKQAHEVRYENLYMISEALRDEIIEVLAKTMPEPDPLLPVREAWAIAHNVPVGISGFDTFLAELAKRGGKIVFEIAPVREVGHE